MEKLFLKKIELWVVLLLMLVFLFITILFSGAVRHYYLGGSRLGLLEPIVENISSFPSKVRTLFLINLVKKDLLAPEQRFIEQQGGFTFNYMAGERHDLGYILVNRYDGNKKYSVSELWDLDSQALIHTWNLEKIGKAWETLTLKSALSNIPVNNSSQRARSFHANLTNNGNLLLHTNVSPLLALDENSDPKIINQDRLFHHSLELDHNGNIWMPSHIEPKTVNLGTMNFLDDGIALVSPNGKVIFEKSVVQILDDNELGYLIYGRGIINDDPIHLNDIEPVLDDGKFWKKGDVFLSIRHQSMILLYRPSTNRIIWYKQGPWLHQHDVNILNDHQISIFNNNAATFKKRDSIVKGVNDIMIYDFSTESISSPWQLGFQKLELRTTTEGRGTVIGNEVFVEETNYGRLVQFKMDGSLVWSYLNRADDNQIYRLNWSRLISKELGDSVRAAIKNLGAQ